MYTEIFDKLIDEHRCIECPFKDDRTFGGGKCQDECDKMQNIQKLRDYIEIEEAYMMHRTEEKPDEGESVILYICMASKPEWAEGTWDSANNKWKVYRWDCEVKPEYILGWRRVPGYGVVSKL